MRRLRDSILALIVHLTILFNIERLDIDGADAINLETAVYGLTALAIIMILLIRGLKTLQPPVLLLLWTGAYFAVKFLLLSQRPIVGDIYTYLTFTEIGLFLIAVFLTQRLALNIEEFEQALKNFVFANNAKVKRVREAEDEIEAEIYRSRRFQRPLSIIVLEQDGSTVQANINRVYQDAQRTLLEQYVSAQVARELAAQLRQTDILLEHDKTGRLIIVSPDTDDAGTDAFIQRLKSFNRSGLFSLNFGAATFPNHALTFEQLLERAELNLQDQITNRMVVDSHMESQKKVNVG
jgi:predicted signal transduction protein with EAL and GGDEF domain